MIARKPLSCTAMSALLGIALTVPPRRGPATMAITTTGIEPSR